MIEFLKGLFTPSLIAKEGASMLDDAFHTPEEKSRWLLSYLEATKPQAIARRVLAFIVAGLWAVCVIVAGVLFFNGDRDLFNAWSEFMAANINDPFSIVIGFYFLSQVVERAFKKK